MADKNETIRDLNLIHDRLQQRTGKMIQQEMQDLFLEDEAFNAESRLIAAEALNLAFSGLYASSYEFTHGVCSNIRIEVLRLSK